VRRGDPLVPPLGTTILKLQVETAISPKSSHSDHLLPDFTMISCLVFPDFNERDPKGGNVDSEKDGPVFADWLISG
jgi:hypothetical protein